jgi:2-dehydropantoate 2-reductase
MVIILGMGAVGSALAVHLSAQGREVLAVRTSGDPLPRRRVRVTVQDLERRETGADLDTVGLDGLRGQRGILVIAAKAYANPGIAARLPKPGPDSPVVVLQNGLGVEDPFLSAGTAEVYRCVLFVTSQRLAENRFAFRSIAPSPIGIVRGSPETLAKIVQSLSTPAFPFVAEERLQERVWQKAIINSVFNSLCPLLEVDNGVFVREQGALQLAAEIVEECLGVTARLGLKLDRGQVLQQILNISRSSSGQPISTLQDIRAGRQTEIESLNLAIARIAGGLTPPLPVERTRLLGELVRLKACLRAAGV